jgi:hypothetical protein
MNLNLPSISKTNIRSSVLAVHQNRTQQPYSQPCFGSENLNYIHQGAYDQLDRLLTKATTHATQQLQKTINDRFDELIKLLTPVNPPYKDV